MSSSATSNSTFTGSSAYASQLQQVIARAVSIASLPIGQLQNTQANLSAQQSELQNVASSFLAVQSAVSSLSSSTGLGSFAATAADTSIVSPTISSGVMAGVYSLDITDIGSQTNTISKSGLQTVLDPGASNIDASSTYTLTVNGHDYPISNTGGTLNGLAQAITNSPADVQATVINAGSPSAPDYRLSIQSLSYAPDTIQLNDGTTDLLKTLSTGSNVTYQVNGQPDTPINSNSRNVTVSPGLTVQLLKAGTTTVTVAQSSQSLAGSLSSFANAYNGVVSELGRNRGQNGGALTGNTLISTLQQQLQSLANYSSGSGKVTSLASLGLTFDTTGNLQFDSSAFNKAAAASPSDLLRFIGTPTSGGFLQSAQSLLTSIADPTTGLIAGASQDMSTELSSLAAKISDDQANVSALQQKLTNQMATVDATISSLQQQVSNITTLFYDMQTSARQNS